MFCLIRLFKIIFYILHVLIQMRHNNTPSKSSFRDWLSIDTGMIVVVFICIMYLVLVFGLLFYVKNEWCDLLFKNMTVSIIIWLHRTNLKLGSDTFTESGAFDRKAQINYLLIFMKWNKKVAELCHSIFYKPTFQCCS